MTKKKSREPFIPGELYVFNNKESQRNSPLFLCCCEPISYSGFFALHAGQIDCKLPMLCLESKLHDCQVSRPTSNNNVVKFLCGTHYLYFEEDSLFATRKKPLYLQDLVRLLS